MYMNCLYVYELSISFNDTSTLAAEDLAAIGSADHATLNCFSFRSFFSVSWFRSSLIVYVPLYRLVGCPCFTLMVVMFTIDEDSLYFFSETALFCWPKRIFQILTLVVWAESSTSMLLRKLLQCTIRMIQR